MYKEKWPHHAGNVRVMLHPCRMQNAACRKRPWHETCCVVITRNREAIKGNKREGGSVVVFVHSNQEKEKIIRIHETMMPLSHKQQDDGQEQQQRKNMTKGSGATTTRLVCVVAVVALVLLLGVVFSCCNDDDGTGSSLVLKAFGLGNNGRSSTITSTTEGSGSSVGFSSSSSHHRHNVRTASSSSSSSSGSNSNNNKSDRTLINRQRPDGSNAQHVVEVGIIQDGKIYEPPPQEDEEANSPAGDDKDTATPVGGDDDDDQDDDIIKELAQKLKPKTLHRIPISELPQYQQQSQASLSNTFPRPKDSKTVTLPKHQFLHLHHMKTGGTSVDTHLQCAMHRLENLGESKNLTIPYTSLHECSESSYKRCLSGEDTKCRERVNMVAIMSYCAPLYDLTTFGWTGDHSPAAAVAEGQNEGDQDDDDDDIVEYSHHNTFHSLTVLRHPVSRAWSMYRFKPQACYKCKTLIDVYKGIDNGNADGLSDMCIQQLNNHMTANLLSSSSSHSIYSKENDRTEDEMVEEAISNLKNFFTMVGLTEQLPETFDIMGYTFPWLNTTIEGSTMTCSLPHSNASPTTNSCTRDDTTGTLVYDKEPPNDETRRIIEQHNSMDLRVYEAAVELFEQQKLAIEYLKKKAQQENGN